SGRDQPISEALTDAGELFGDRIGDPAFNLGDSSGVVGRVDVLIGIRVVGRSNLTDEITLKNALADVVNGFSPGTLVESGERPAVFIPYRIRGTARAGSSTEEQPTLIGVSWIFLGWEGGLVFLAMMSLGVALVILLTRDMFIQIVGVQLGLFNLFYVGGLSDLVQRSLEAMLVYGAFLLATRWLLRDDD